MSYILDALRRAEADRERERGQVPGLHTAPPPGGEAAPAAGRRWLPWAGGGLLLLAGLGAGSWWAGSAPPPAPPAPAPLPLPTPSAPPISPVAAPPAGGAAQPPASPYLGPPVPPAPLPTAPVPRPAPAAPAAEDAIPRLTELPESLRRELPRLAISGSIYSDDPASRFVMINGEAQREGARLGPDLVLEQIRPRELVLRFKGQRFRQPV